MIGTTPVRELALPVERGCWLLNPRADVDYLDGAEEVVGMIVAEALDRTSASDELSYAAASWPERYHLDLGRANLVRALDLPSDAAVLEIGAGCGAITRCLGERTALVDAVEPVSARATVAAARTADLPGVRVFVGTVDGLPDEPAYDLAVVVGVLEYVGGGARESAPYLDFLRALRRRLRPGGVLCLAIENQFGVKYLAGAPEDHTGRPWDGPQGYPHGGAARTFGNAPLRSLLTSAGFTGTRVFGCFPDYKITRAVLTDELAARFPRLAKEIPHLPSPDWAAPDTVRPVDEARLWSELVDAGLAAQAWNSFLVLADDGAPRAQLWPADRLATYFNTDRASRWCTRADVRHAGPGVRVQRGPLFGAAGDPSTEPVAVRPYAEPVVDGPTVLSVLLAQPWRAEELLTGWRDLVRARAADYGPALWDLVPHNLVVTQDGLRPIDLEWQFAGVEPADVEARGVLLAADRLAASGWRGAGAGSTVGELAAWLSVLLGIDSSTVDSAVEREAWFQAVVRCGATTGGGLSRELHNMRAAWRDRLADPVATDSPDDGGTMEEGAPT